MRRSDREITDAGRIRDVIDGCTVCRIAFSSENGAYIVPLNFGYELENGRYVFWFHGAKDGRKIDMIKASERVGFEMDCGYRLNEAEYACGYSSAWKSIIGTGKIEIVSDMSDKIKGLNLIMKKCTGKDEWTYGVNMLSEVCVFKVTAQELSCKEHQ